MYSLEERIIKFPSKKYSHVVPIKTIPGHFATTNSHINCYVDLTTIKARQAEAREVARAMADQYSSSTIVDTIVCLEGTEVIGAYMADELINAGVTSYNQHSTIYIAVPEILPGSQLLFRDNMQMMLKDKNVLLLVASCTTGTHVTRGVECIEYYGGNVVGVSAIFSAITKTKEDVPVHAVFTGEDIGFYSSYKPRECPLCKVGMPIEAMVNAYGYSKL